MGNTTPVIRRGEKLLADHLLAAKCIPETELSLEPAIGLFGDAARNERLRIDDLPVLETRRRIRVEIFSMKAPLSMGAKRPDRSRSAAMTDVIFDQADQPKENR